MVTPPLAGFILYGYREEVRGMLTAIRRGLARFWYGPTGAPGATTFFPDEADEEGWAEMEEEDRRRRDFYWFNLREEDDDRHCDEYTLRRRSRTDA